MSIWYVIGSMIPYAFAFGGILVARATNAFFGALFFFGGIGSILFLLEHLK